MIITDYKAFKSFHKSFTQALMCFILFPPLQPCHTEEGIVVQLTELDCASKIPAVMSKVLGAFF